MNPAEYKRCQLNILNIYAELLTVIKTENLNCWLIELTHMTK